ncbi:hypothetical protein F2Q69_00054561 [Brassica cretica]|uniref:Uncharacterized protein n=1 Tax=Brassica cretica TaxID=69181 RepID=A0A8S9MYC7_BRACR|nr:hypothetical protein F2Q69_00054561 [Brassica cretica]
MTTTFGPLIAKHLGGSDAEHVIAGIDVPKTAPYIIHSSDAFNHTDTPPGEQPTNWKPDPEDPTSHHHSLPHVYPNLMDTRTPQSVPSTTTQHRKYPHGQPATCSAGVQRQHNPHGQPTYTPSGVHKSSTPHAPKKKKLVPNKYGRCGGTGHNRTNCVVPI